MNVRPTLESEAPTATDDGLWFKDAIIYQLHVKAFHDSNGDGIGDFAGLTERLDYLRDLGVTALWLLPFYPEPRPRRRLRHLRLRRYQSVLRHHEGFSPLHAGGQAARSARHHRARHQPHLRPARLVQARQAQRAGLERAQLVRLERYRPEIPGHAHHLHRHREVELDLGCGSRRLLLASLLFASAGPQLRQSARGQRRAAGDEALARCRRRRVPSRRGALPLRARRHQQRKPAGDARGPQAPARRARRLRAQQGAAGRGQSVAGRRAAVFRRRRRMPHGLSLPADAAHLHGDRAGRPLPDHRHHAADAGNSRRIASGRCFCATTTN